MHSVSAPPPKPALTLMYCDTEWHTAVDLFCKMQLTKTLSHMLRARGHAFQLPTCVYNLHKKSFVISCPFKFLA